MTHIAFVRVTMLDECDLVFRTLLDVFLTLHSKNVIKPHLCSMGSHSFPVIFMRVAGVKEEKGGFTFLITSLKKSY